MQYGLFEYYNPNPIKANHGDCVVRALCKALNKPWEDVYVALCMEGLTMCDLPNSDAVWGAYLRSQGFRRYVVPNTCPDCYTVADFSQDRPEGTYVLGTGRHAVTVQDGVIYDNWRSDSEIPVFYFTKEVI